MSIDKANITWQVWNQTSADKWLSK